MSKSRGRWTTTVVVIFLLLGTGVVVLLNYDEIHRKHLWIYTGGEPSWVTDTHATLTVRKVTLNFPEVPLEDLAGYLQDLTGISFILDSSVDGKNIYVNLDQTDIYLGDGLRTILDQAGLEYVYVKNPGDPINDPDPKWEEFLNIHPGVYIYNPESILNLEEACPGYYQPPQVE